MKELFGIPYNKFLFHLLSYNLSGFLCYISYLAWALIMTTINPKFPIGSRGYSDNLAIFNIFIISIIATFLIYFVKNIKIHILLILALEIIVFGIVILLFYNDRGTKIEGFYDNIIISLPYMLISSLLIYLVQLILGKKLLPTKYKNH